MGIHSIKSWLWEKLKKKHFWSVSSVPYQRLKWNFEKRLKSLAYVGKITEYLKIFFQQLSKNYKRLENYLENFWIFFYKFFLICLLFHTNWFSCINSFIYFGAPEYTHIKKLIIKDLFVLLIKLLFFQKQTIKC